MSQARVFRATFGSAMGYYLVGAVFFLAAVVNAWFAAGWTGLMLWSISIGLALNLALVRWRYRVTVSDAGMESRTVFRNTRLSWVGLQRVDRANDRGWVSAVMSGASTFRFVAIDGECRINFKFFPAACFKEVMDRVPRPDEATV